jgi:hypothetical protein
MAALTVEDVCNMAMGIIDEAPIGSLDDNTKAARLLNLHFETTRQAELTKQAWAFAIFRVELDGEAGGLRIPFKQEGSLILTNYTGPRLIRYIGNMTDPADWDPLFVEALAARLAMKIAMPLTHKDTVLRGAKVAYEEAIADARRINSIVVSSVPASQSWAEGRGDMSDVR